MTTRQYAQKSIFDLEEIFERSRNNASELERLLNELTFRNTAKARTLRTKIEQARTVLSGHCVISMSDSSPSARHLARRPHNPPKFRPVMSLQR